MMWSSAALLISQNVFVSNLVSSLLNTPIKLSGMTKRISIKENDHERPGHPELVEG